MFYTQWLARFSHSLNSRNFNRARKTQAARSAPRKLSNWLCLEELEERTVPTIAANALIAVAPETNGLGDTGIYADSCLSQQTPITKPIQVVFIDSRVPDLSGLETAIGPNAKVFVLDANRDGFQQISAILTTNHLSDGSCFFPSWPTGVPRRHAGVRLCHRYRRQLIRRDEASLAQIGSYIIQGGVLQLYSCDVAQGAAGERFIGDLSRLANGIDVAAATHVVGNNSLGGSWDLDASTGQGQPISPFKTESLASYTGKLAIKYTVAGTSPFPSLEFGSRIVTADFNNDGKPDLLYEDDSGNIDLALGNGNGTFQTPISTAANVAFTSGPLTGIALPGVSHNTTVFAVDLNGDGKVDLVVDPGATSAISIYMNTGTGFTSVSSSFFPIQHFTGRLVFGDFNNDGYMDILEQSNNTSGANISLFVNAGNGSIAFNEIDANSSGTFTSGPLSGLTFTQVVSTSVFAEDLNGDGKVDLIDAQANTAIKVYQNTGTGFTSVANPFPMQAFLGRWVFGDFNSDGYVDVLELNQSNTPGTQ